MITDEEVKLLFQNTWRTEGKKLDLSKPYPEQLYRGIGPQMWKNAHPGGCTRHIMVFQRFHIIPRYCFNCYKVLVEPRNVVEHFKLMMVFEQLKLPNDNTRKCTVELREKVSGTYKGLIYCTGIEEGREIADRVRKVISEEISEKIPVTLKRGCSEYPLAFPEYGEIGQDAPLMQYNEDWQKYEEIAEKQLIINRQTPANSTFNSPNYTPHDAHVMMAWLMYAATIGDESYLKICWPLEPFSNLKRPSAFNPIEDEK